MNAKLSLLIVAIAMFFSACDKPGNKQKVAKGSGSNRSGLSGTGPLANLKMNDDVDSAKPRVVKNGTTSTIVNKVTSQCLALDELGKRLATNSYPTIVSTYDLDVDTEKADVSAFFDGFKSSANDAIRANLFLPPSSLQPVWGLGTSADLVTDGTTDFAAVSKYFTDLVGQTNCTSITLKIPLANAVPPKLITARKDEISFVDGNNVGRDYKKISDTSMILTIYTIKPAIDPTIVADCKLSNFVVKQAFQITLGNDLGNIKLKKNVVALIQSHSKQSDLVDANKASVEVSMSPLVYQIALQSLKKTDKDVCPKN